MLFITAFLFVYFCSSVLAISSGKVSLCDATPDVYGCVPGGWEKDEEGNDKRKYCKDKSRIMAWATAPVKDGDTYRLYVGEDEDNTLTEYVPGKHYTVHLRVRKYDKQYRGLLMYAVDENEEKVGDWDFKDRADIFHSFCPKSVLHASGTDKPYLSTWGFTAPPAGTGTIHFRSLIKTGVANVGDFWFANDLSLTEASGADAIAPTKRWYRATEAGQTCTEVCKTYCQTCVEEELTDIDSPAKVEELIAPYTTCTLPYLARCGAEGPTSSKTGLCFYRDEAFCKEKKMAVEPTTCDSKPPAREELAYRLCPCDGVECTPAPTPEPTPAPTPAPEQQPMSSTQQYPIPSDCNAKAEIGCPCPAGDAKCSPGGVCREGVCAPASPCERGADGCECNEDRTCNNAEFTCSDATNRCIVEYRNYCDDHNGEVGCWCTAGAQGCLSSDLFCDHTKNCVKKAPICEPGNVGCPCLEGDCRYGLQCAGVSEICAVITDEDITTAAGALLPTLALLVASVLAAF